MIGNNLNPIAEKHSIMITTRNLILALLLCLYFSNAFSQSRKFPSPASADARPSRPRRRCSDSTALRDRPCHGSKGKGDGIAAPGLSKPPADHTSDFVQKQTDGALFWIISQGNNPMPTYKTTLNETQRWQVVNFIRTLAKTKKN